MIDKDKIKELARAYKLGLRTAYKNPRYLLSLDDARWITVHPNGKGVSNGGGDIKGRAALIDTETGTILGGIGGKFNGRSVSNMQAKPTKEGKERVKAHKEGKIKVANPNGPTTPITKTSQPATPSPSKPKGVQIDLKLPDKLDTSNILQNRNRSTLGSVRQVQNIAANPDFLRMGMTHDFTSGAPVISYGTYKPEQMGKKSIAVTPDGQRYSVQYAVVEADDVQTSNSSQGNPNEKYYSDDPKLKRAIAGNGRMSAMTLAYNRGTAGQYRQEMTEAADEHGISADVISKMKSPVLVRVMQPSDVTKDIGDKSNIQSGLQMSAVEQAQNDKNRVDFNEVKTYSDGSPTKEAVKEFVLKMPISEQGNLLDVDGNPTKQAQTRMQNALFAKAYESDDLIRQASQAWEPEAKNITAGLMRAAPKMQKLAGLPDGYDVRDIVSTAVQRAYAHVSKGKSLKDAYMNTDLFESSDRDAAERELLKMFGSCKSSKEIGDKLNKLADTLYNTSQNIQSISGGGDLFAALIPTETPSALQTIKRALGQDGKPRKMSARARSIWALYSGDFLNNLFNGNEPTANEFFKRFN